MLPGDIEVHFFADPELATPITHRAMAFASTDPEAERESWGKSLGAETFMEAGRSASAIPGSRLFLIGADTLAAPTRGRTLDHTGIGVADVGTFCEQLAAKGVECEIF